MKVVVEKKAVLIGIIVLVLIIIVFFVGGFLIGKYMIDNKAGGSGITSKPKPSQSIPNDLAGLHIAKSLSGKQAEQELSSLHNGLSFKPEKVFIGYYGQKAKIILWVSFEESDSRADLLFSKMSPNSVGKYGFKNVKRQEYKGVSVISADGSGSKHYYFRKGASVVWLAAPKEYSRTALDDLITYGERNNW